MMGVLEKMILSDKEFEYLSKGISLGVLVGLILGTILNNPQFGFALGGVCGIVLSFIYTLVRRLNFKSDKK